MRKIVPPDAKLIPKEAKLVFSGILNDIYQWQQLMFDGTYSTFEMVRRHDTVKVLAIKDGQVVVVKQEQPNYVGVFYDIPGGRHDDESEDELVAAQREMREETGMTFKNWKLLEVWQPRDSVDQLVYIYLATEFESQVEQMLDAGEKIEVLTLDLAAARALAERPDAQFLPSDLLNSVENVDDFALLPEYSGN